MKSKLLLTSGVFLLAACAASSPESSSGPEVTTLRTPATSAESEAPQHPQSPTLTPLASILQDADGKHLLVPHHKGVAATLYQRARENPTRYAVILSALESSSAPEIVSGIAEALSNSNPACWLDHQVWNSILESLRDLPILRPSAHQKRLESTLAQHSCSDYPVKDQLTIPAEPSFIEKYLKPVRGRAFDSLAFFQTQLGKEVAVIETSEGKLNLVGNLITIRYEDVAQTTELRSFVAQFEQQSAEAGLHFQTTNGSKISLMAHAYTYAMTTDFDHFDSHFGREVYIAYQKVIADHFSMQLSVHFGNGGRYANQSYTDVRITGKYIPKFWR